MCKNSNLKICYNKAIFGYKNSLYMYIGNRGFRNMRKFAKKLSAIALCTVLASMQMASAMDVGLNDATINHTQGGFAGLDSSSTAGNAVLNFNGNALVNWDRLNVGANESLQFNAVNNASGLTVVNTVNSGMSNFHGKIGANEGIQKLIISNPNGMLFDGAQFTTVHDLHLTTQQLNAIYNAATGNVDIGQSTVEALKGIEIKDNSNFNIGGDFIIAAPNIDIANSVLKATGTNGLKLVTKDGQNYLLCPTASGNVNHIGVSLDAVQVDGKLYILAGKDIIKILNGGTVNGDLVVESSGGVGLNYAHNEKNLHVKGDTNVNTSGEFAYLRNVTVDKNLNVTNEGGYVEIARTHVKGNATLTTTEGIPNTTWNKYVHVVGNNTIDGDLTVNSSRNIHIGGYAGDFQTLADGKLVVGGDLTATTQNGTIAVTIDTEAKNVDFDSSLNIISDGKATIKANDYKLKADYYIGGIEEGSNIAKTMENYPRIPYTTAGKKVYLNVDGGKISKLETAQDGYAVIKSNNDLTVDGVNANIVHLTSNKDIKIEDNVHADFIQVDGDTRNLRVNNNKNSRDYTLRYTNIRDTQRITINPNEEITYEMANGDNGWNKGTQTHENTYLVVDAPVVPNPPTPPVTPSEPDTPVTPGVPDDNENVKILNNLQRDQVASAIDAQQVYTPVAFAADLDEEIKTGVRKNVDGSVTVVRPFTPTKD